MAEFPVISLWAQLTSSHSLLLSPFPIFPHCEPGLVPSPLLPILGLLFLWHRCSLHLKIIFVSVAIKTVKRGNEFRVFCTHSRHLLLTVPVCSLLAFPITFPVRFSCSQMGHGEQGPWAPLLPHRSLEMEMWTSQSANTKLKKRTNQKCIAVLENEIPGLHLSALLFQQCGFQISPDFGLLLWVPGVGTHSCPLCLSTSPSKLLPNKWLYINPRKFIWTQIFLKLFQGFYQNQPCKDL